MPLCKGLPDSVHHYSHLCHSCLESTETDRNLGERSGKPWDAGCDDRLSSLPSSVGIRSVAHLMSAFRSVWCSLLRTHSGQEKKELRFDALPCRSQTSQGPNIHTAECWFVLCGMLFGLFVYLRLHFSYLSWPGSVLNYNSKKSLYLFSLLSFIFTPQCKCVCVRACVCWRLSISSVSWKSRPVLTAASLIRDNGQ